MIIFEQIREVLKDKIGCVVTSSEIKNHLQDTFGTNGSSVILADYCYNRINDGIRFKKETRIFEYKSRGKYKYLGQGYPYTGKIVHKPIKSKVEKIVGEWINGQMTYPI